MERGTKGNELKVAFYTLGCRLNQAETALIEESFIQEGHQIVPFGEEAELFVINSCTVTEKGDADCRKMVRRFKRNNPNGKVAVIGCYSQVATDAVSQIPGVNLVVGNREKMRLVQYLDQLNQSTGQPVVIREALGKQESFTIDIRNAHQKTVRANLKIQDGCDFFCSFCVIPFARGRAHSRQFEDLIREAHELAENGHKELVLTGINVGTYHYNQYNFMDVLKALEKIPGIERIRISSIEPTTVDEDFLKYMADSPKLCHYLHLPLQSGSNPILERMNRKYTTEEFEKYVENALKIVPDLLLGTDIIVGFPGETEELFEETYRFAERMPFAYFHVFSYSDRNLAKSSKFEDKIPNEVIKRRSGKLRELGMKKKQAHYSRYKGKVVRVLFEQKKNGLWQGHDDHYILVQVDSPNNLKNQIYPVQIIDVEGDKAKGILV
jgi:threonylcarbamoyladenosine tRNA methylthiotransferase MtaB